MDIETAQNAISQLKKMLKKTVNDEDKKLFQKLKNELSDISPIILKNKIQRLTYLYDWGNEEFFMNEVPPEQICEFSINRLIRFYEEKIFDLSPSETMEDLYKKKLLNAKNNNIDFFEELGAMVVGDTEFFPYRSSMFISRFFEEAGYPHLRHDGGTRRLWAASQLEAMDINDLFNVLKHLFKKRYFIEAAKLVNGKEVDIIQAKRKLKELIDSSCEEDEFEDLRDVFDLNINTTLLFNQKIATADNTLNQQIELARKFYINNDLQLALEKIWDAFERIKSSFHKDKKKSVSAIISTLSDEITNPLGSKCDEKDLFFNKELYELTSIGNNYKIRHFETEKKELSNRITMEYLFFRMLNLINLIHIRMTLQHKD